MSVIIRPPGEGEVLPVGPTISRVLVAGAQTGGRLSVVEMTIEPEFGGPPRHQHRRLDHVWYVLAGVVRLDVDGRVGEHAVGACVYVPHGAGHTFSNPYSAPTRLLQVDSPMALDGYFRDLAEAFPAGSVVDPARVLEIMSRHDTWPAAGDATDT